MDEGICGELRWRSCGTLQAMTAAKSVIQPDAAPTLFKNAKAFEAWLKKSGNPPINHRSEK